MCVTLVPPLYFVTASVQLESYSLVGKKRYKKTAMGIQQSLNILERDGTEVKIQWRPGHANIRGNEMADRLAKEAAKEAGEMKDDIGIASQSDVKSAARESVNIKWQRRLEVSEKGRNLFTHRPGVKLNKVQESESYTAAPKWLLQIERIPE